ncbi:MAG TPA: hypothetical protein VFR15_20060 [Chloroflexia bacterium]|nr:hypothetical protein [Chloroflexia bacterium]
MEQQISKGNGVHVRDAAAAAGGWLLSLFVVPVLGLIALGFGLVAVLAPALGVLRTFGIDWVQMEMFDWHVPVLWSVPAALVISVVTGAFSLGAAVMLRSYLAWIRSGFGAEK